MSFHTHETVCSAALEVEELVLFYCSLLLLLMQIYLTKVSEFKKTNKVLI
ncbi:hypothetical protein BMETH_674_0 [methanotrophic bacterial endosymbiont of Bathymodiolus sp.]|nr:hypothetical protein BMETH_674_0 [methanotrophic bacterial endosymbiont of Bathymodiolus sp.]